MTRLTVLTPDDPNMVAALTSFRLDGVVTTSANEAVTKHLVEKFGVLTICRTGPAAGDCIRVTPSVYTSADDVMKLVNALRSITASPRSAHMNSAVSICFTMSTDGYWRLQV